jgi:site-specific DNA-cytosine methylase
VIGVTDLFCGIGMVEQALKELGIGHKTVAVGEIDGFAL